MLATQLLPIAGMRMRIKPSAARRLFDIAAWKDPAYVAFALASFLGFLGLYIPFFYVQLYSIEKHIMKPDLAFYLVPVLNAGSFFGRLVSLSMNIQTKATVANKIHLSDTKLHC